MKTNMERIKVVEGHSEKISSGDCVETIINYFYSKGEERTSPLCNPKKWKRKTKRGSETIIREFENSDTKTRIEVLATNSKILNVKVIEKEEMDSNSVYFFAWHDKDADINIIAFGTEDEIKNDRLTGENLDDDIFELKDFFEDSEEFCEDYLISTDVSLNDIDKELISRGYIKNKRLKNIGWG